MTATSDWSAVPTEQRRKQFVQLCTILVENDEQSLACEELAQTDKDVAEAMYDAVDAALGAADDEEFGEDESEEDL